MAGKAQRHTRANEAAEWFLRLREDDLSEAELSEWLRWCADQDNLNEFQKMRSTWRGFEQLEPAASEMIETMLGDVEGTITNARKNALEPLEKAPRARSAPRRWMRPQWIGLAASVAMAVVSTAFYLGWQSRTPTSIPAVAPPIASVHSTVLPDGSELTLAPSTQVAVNFNAGLRKLELSHGEAYFDVKHDPTHPFVVQTAALKVTAVGTAFDVRSRSGRVIVTVEDGAVEVARLDGDSSAGTWRVAAGYQISYDAKQNSARIVAVDAQSALGWREGRLEYFAEPLTNVAADVSRYAQRSIEIGDRHTGQLSFTGTVFVANVDDWLAAVEATFPVEIVRQDDHVVLRAPATVD